MLCSVVTTMEEGELKTFRKISPFFDRTSSHVGISATPGITCSEYNLDFRRHLASPACFQRTYHHGRANSHLGIESASRTNPISCTAN
jgi:hypothetical protein